jgi:hypothetical protein
MANIESAAGTNILDLLRKFVRKADKRPIVPKSFSEVLREQGRINGEHPAFVKDEWGFDGTDMCRYDDTFKKVLDGRKISDILTENREEITWLDIMASTKYMEEVFNKITGAKFGVAVVLSDKRNEEQINKDNKLRIKLVTGNVAESRTWKKIEEALDGRKAKFITERANIGLDYLPVDERFYYTMVNHAWNLLEVDGMLLMQTKNIEVLTDSKIRIKMWLDLLRKNGVIAVFGSGNYFGDALKLVKTSDSPENLPFLK